MIQTVTRYLQFYVRAVVIHNSNWPELAQASLDQYNIIYSTVNNININSVPHEQR